MQTLKLDFILSRFDIIKKLLEMDFKLFRKMRCTRILLFTITAILLTNCTIQKRTFNKGYFVQCRLRNTNLMERKLENNDMTQLDLKESIKKNEIKTTNIKIASSKTSNMISHHLNGDDKTFVVLY